MNQDRALSGDGRTKPCIIDTILRFCVVKGSSVGDGGEAVATSWRSSYLFDSQGLLYDRDGSKHLGSMEVVVAVVGRRAVLVP